VVEIARQRGQHEGQIGLRLAAQQFDGGAREDFESHHGRRRISGQPEEKPIGGASEYQRLTWLDAHAVEIEFRAHIAEDTLDEVILAGGNSARDQQEVGREPALDEAERVVVLILGNREKDRDPACPRDLRGQRVQVRVANLELARRFSNGYDLVACGQQRDSRLRAHGHARFPDRREHGDVREAQPLAWGENGFSGLGFTSPRIDELSAVGDTPDGHGPVGAARHMLHHDNGIGAARHRRSGHDLDSFAWPHLARENLSGPYFADHAQRTRHVRRAYRKTVTDGARERRIIAIGANLLGQHASGHALQRNFLGRREHSLGQDALDHACACLVEAHRGHKSILHAEPERTCKLRRG